MWKTGEFIIDGIMFRYEAKVYDVGSPLGINNGRVSKLQVINGDKPNDWSYDNTIINYDRGWDVKPRDEISKKALKYILDIFK